MSSRYLLGASAAAVAMVLAGTAAAQSALGPERTVTGRLQSTDPVSSTGGYYDAWRVTAAPGERVVLSMTSSDFDAYLQIGRALPGGGFNALMTDDDGGDGLNSLLDFIATEGGEYEVRATSFISGGTGTYSLSRSAAPIYTSSTLNLPVYRSGYLGAGDYVRDGGQFYDAYRIFVPQNHVIRITMNSADVDSWVELGYVGEGYYDFMDSDDDGGEGLNSVLYFQAVADSEFEVRASTWSGGEGGYDLTIEDVSVDSSGGLPFDAEVSGYLTEGDLNDYDGGPEFEYRNFYASAGQRVRVTMRSDEFDSYLYVGRWIDGRFNEISRDDDSGGGNTGLDSQVDFIAPVSGMYWIKASSLGSGQSGRYDLVVTSW